MKVTPAELALLRTRPQQVELKLAIFKPPIVFACRVNDVNIAKTDMTIAYDTVSVGNFLSVKAGMTMYVGTVAGKADVGRVRIKTIDSTSIKVAENGLDWADNQYLTVVEFYELWPKSSLDVQNGTNIIHYIDYDQLYDSQGGQQNAYMGTFLCIGPPAICEAGQSIPWSTSGTVQTDGLDLNYVWNFGGGSPATGTSSEPGNVQYNTPGYYMTELAVTPTITGTGMADSTYRPVIVLGGSVQPYTNWGFDSIDGSRDEGSWTAKMWLREENMPEVMDGSLCIIYQDCYYGSTRQNIGGNSPNRQKILFIGYIIDNSIQYDWNQSRIDFSVTSPTGRMKLLEGLSVSMDNVSGVPTDWQQVQYLNGKKALYYYLKWHTTVLSCCDVHWLIDPDPEIPSWDSEISSIYDIIQKFVDTYYLGEVVSDRQGGIWIEKHPKSIHAVTGTFNTVLDLDRQDWMGEIDITEQLNSPVSYLEMHGLSYAGIVTGTVGDYLSAAPYINKRNPFGKPDFLQGYVVNDQVENNQIVGDVFAYENARFPAEDIKLAGWYSLFDTAPEECITLSTVREDTVRGIVWNKKSFLIREMSIEWDAKNKILLPTISLHEVTQGTPGATVPIPVPVEPPSWPDLPPIEPDWPIIPFPWDWPKPPNPPPGDTCRGNAYATSNGPYALPFNRTEYALGDVGYSYVPCYIRASTVRYKTTIRLDGICYGAEGWNGVLVEAIDGGGGVVASAACMEDHSMPGAHTYGVYQFSLPAGKEVAGFKITVTAGSTSVYSAKDVVSSVNAPATSTTGIPIGGLVIGQWYAAENAGGPWSDTRRITDLYAYGGQFNKGSGFQENQIVGLGPGYDGVRDHVNDYTIVSGECVYAEYVDSAAGVYARGYFQATQSTYYWMVNDLIGSYPYHTGSLGCVIRHATVKTMQLIQAIITNICL